MSGIRREHVRVLNVDDETGHTGPLPAVGIRVVTEGVTAIGGRPCRGTDGSSVPRVGHSGVAHSRIARGGVPHAVVPHAVVLDGTRHDTAGPEHRTAGPEPRTDGLTDGLTSAPTIHTGRGATYAAGPMEDGR
ncbi:hypothetical protein QFZ24_002902 [Streptomyces phaeochromogenes]|uniref:hypothetical protein n=1 Tax=Streptomyces phaeochromogenes TaxID=1923 RepID=UPI002791ED64|nr:hypothetical protein [Streptomyces phaeochromogenes]MDQ0948979.1 hypothetical protein [Streptomyces phaeochromogenes]